jgi:hypothetical protein
MDPRQLYFDDRLRGVCPLCGQHANTKDHVPPKMFLDDPLPPNTGTVEMCAECNQGSSADEEYVACLIDVCLVGGDATSSRLRPRIQRAFEHSEALRHRVQSAIILGDGYVLDVEAERHRIDRVVEKIARGIWAYETGETYAGRGQASWQILSHMHRAERDAFESYTEPQLFPEIGSRLFCSISAHDGELVWPGWRDVQDGRFRYLIDTSVERCGVRMVVSEYLATEVIWLD